MTSRSQTVLRLLVLAFGLAPFSLAQEEKVGTAKDLIAKFGEALPGLEEEGERLFWSDGNGHRLAIVDALDGHPVLETVIGRLAVDKSYFQSGHPETLLSLESLAVAARQAGLGAAEEGGDAGYVFEWEPLTGYRLRSEARIVCPAGVLSRGEGMSPSGSEVEAVRQAVIDLKRELASSSLTELGRRAVADVVDRLARRDEGEGVDEVAPSFGRRLVRHGWFDRLEAVSALRGAKVLSSAVATATTLRKTLVYAAEGVELASFENAFGEGGWVLRTPAGVTYAVAPPLPEFHWMAKESLAGTRVVVELPAAVDPLAEGDFSTQIRSATLYQGRRRLVSWNAVEGLTADLAAWREVVPDRHPKMLDANIVANYMPPHIVAADPSGDIEVVLTENGPLVPPADSSAEEAERFLSEAAERLPDAAHLDLITQYLFKYVYDSPESTSPLIIGNREAKGDIHQTAQETLATVAGGVCRGDCDDLSELFVTLASRQGRLAYVINLPAHAAAAWCEEKDGKWHTYVMQTGPTLEFVDKNLPKSLEAAYRSFDATETFDPHGLGILLRFSGENTRSSWILGYRIFSEPDYAALMIDVQKDWHFQTYLQGIEKMKRVLESGDTDTANLRELASLYRFTGQYELGAGIQEEAIAKCQETESKLYLSIELIDYYGKTGDHEKLRQVVKGILDDQLPGLTELQKGVQIRIALQIADALVRAQEYELAAEVMSGGAVEAMAGVQQNTIQFFESPRYNERQWLDTIFLRDLLRDHVSSSISLLEKLGPERIATDPGYRRMAEDVQRYLDHIAMRDADDGADRLMRYSFAGRYYAALLGKEEFERRLGSAGMPAGAEYDHLERMNGLGQVWLDLPWIKASVSYWYGEIIDLLGDEADSVDPERLAYVHGRLHEADQAARRLGLADLQTDYMTHMADVAVSVVLGWDEKLRERLRHVKAQNDRRLRDDTAMWMGDVARFTPIESYGRAIAIWTDVLDYKPKYYWIAWRAALGRAPEHAILVARVASERFSDDPDFVAEYEFMRDLYSGE